MDVEVRNGLAGSFADESGIIGDLDGTLFFVAGAIYSGIAAIIILMAVLRWVLHLEEFITKTQFLNLGYLLAALAAIMGYLNISEYLTTGYKMEEGIRFHIQQLMLGPFAGLFWFYILGGIFLPILLPVVQELKIDILWFTTLVAVNLQTAFLSPPVAMAAETPQIEMPEASGAAHSRGNLKYRRATKYTRLQ